VSQLLKGLWINETDSELNTLMTVGPNEQEELQGILKSLKNKKSSGSDGMNTEILKYTPIEIKIKYLNIINICCRMHIIPDEWTRGVNCPDKVYAKIIS
jgi:hypothetical protein